MFLLGLVVCLAAAGVVVFSFSSDTAAAESQALSSPANPLEGHPVEAPVTPAEVSTSAGVFRPSERAQVVDAAPRSKRTYGLIRGDVTLTAGTIDRIDAVTIRILEAVRDDAGTGTGRKPYTYQYTIPFHPKDGTPRFSIDEVPFSDFGFLVQAFVPGLNGTEQMVQLNEGHPIADVVLGAL